jgi:hypothetical protein
MIPQVYLRGNRAWRKKRGHGERHPTASIVLYNNAKSAARGYKGLICQ